jgi:phage terminase small subunit
MTKKQIDFCKMYIDTKDKIAAYQSVYSCSEATARNRADELLNRDDVREYIDQKCATEVTSDFIVSNLKDIAQNSAKESDRIRALEILAKLTGVFASMENELVIKIDY